MSFTDAEKVSITKITGVDRITLDAVLDLYASYITEATETAVRDELDRWEDSGGKFVKVHPTESNFGVETNSGDAKSDIRQNIANMLFLSDYAGVGAAQGVLMRG